MSTPFERLCENMNKRKADDLVGHVETKKIKTNNIKKSDGTKETKKVKKAKKTKNIKKIEKIFGFTTRKKNIKVNGAPDETNRGYKSYLTLKVITGNDSWCNSDINVKVLYYGGTDVIIKKDVYDEMVRVIGDPHIVSKSMYGGGVTSRYSHLGLIVTGKSNIQYDFPNVTSMCKVCNERKDEYSIHESFKITSDHSGNDDNRSYDRFDIGDKIRFDYEHDKKAIIKGVCVDCYLKNSIIRMESKRLFSCKGCNESFKIAAFNKKLPMSRDKKNLFCEECYSGMFSRSYFPKLGFVQPGDKVGRFLKFKVVS